MLNQFAFLGWISFDQDWLSFFIYCYIQIVNILLGYLCLCLWEIFFSIFLIKPLSDFGIRKMLATYYELGSMFFSIFWRTCYYFFLIYIFGRYNSPTKSLGHGVLFGEDSISVLEKGLFYLSIAPWVSFSNLCLLSNWSILSALELMRIELFVVFLYHSEPVSGVSSDVLYHSWYW